MNILEVMNLSKIYHTKSKEIVAIKDFSLKLKKGEFISIVGPSGSGKSTILSILCDLIKPSKGKIIKNKNIKVGYMLQNDNLLEFRTIYKNCILGLELSNSLNDKNKKRVLKMLEDYGLKDFIDSYPSSLSGGMRQRASLIRTLATNPDILLLDEPFSALDYQTRVAVCDDIYKIIKKENKSAIMVTHDLAEGISLINIKIIHHIV